MLHDGENERDSVLTAQDGTMVHALLAVNGIAKIFCWSGNSCSSSVECCNEIAGTQHSV